MNKRNRSQKSSELLTDAEVNEFNRRAARVAAWKRIMAEVKVVFSIVLLSTSFTIVVNVLFSRFSRFKPETSETLESRVKVLSDSLAEAVSIVGELEREIESRQSVAKELHEEIETNTLLAQFNAEEAEAVAELVGRKLSHSFWRDTAMGSFFTFIGVIATIITGKFFGYKKEP